jgi:hypothetical protein
MLLPMAGRRRRSKAAPTLLADVLDGSYASPLLSTFSWWDRAVPERVAQVARPVHLGRGTLVVHTKSAAWAQELSFLAEDLLRSVQRRVPHARIERLRFRVGPLPARPPRKEPRRPRVDPLAVAELPSDVARNLARVTDDGLREALSRAVRTSMAREQKEESR